MKSFSLLIVLLFAVLVSSLSAYQNSFFGLISPTELGSFESEISIQHRFKGKIDEEPFDTFFGTQGGANVALFYRQAILHRAELKLGYIRDDTEYVVDGSWCFTPLDFPVQAQANIEFFSYKDFLNPDKRHKATTFLLAVQNKPILDRFILNINYGYETDKDRFITGLGAGMKVLPSLTLLGEYYPDQYDVTALEDIANFTRNRDSFAIGAKLDTYGHHFMFIFGNNDTMMLRKTSLGSADKNWKFGFNIQRQMDFFNFR